MEISGGEHRAPAANDVVDAQLPGGSVMRLRVAEQREGLENVARQSAEDLKEAFGTIEEVASLLKEKLVAMAPTRASVEFGVSLIGLLPLT